MNIRSVEQLEEKGRQWDRVMEDKGLPIVSGPVLVTPPAPDLKILPKLSEALVQEPRKVRELMSGVDRLTTETLTTLRENRTAFIDLRTKEGVFFLLSVVGPNALGEVAIGNRDGTVTRMFGATTPITGLESGAFQLTWIGVENSAGIYEVPPHLDPTHMERFSPKDLLTRLSGSNQLALVGEHDPNAPIKANDPRHQINTLMKLARPHLSNHTADLLENSQDGSGKRRLLATTSVDRIIPLDEIGNNIFQDPEETTEVFFFSELFSENLPEDEQGVDLAFGLKPEFMDQDKLTKGEFAPKRTDDPEALATLYRMGVGVRMMQGYTATDFARLVPANGLIAAYS